MITTDIPPVQRRSSLKKAAPRPHEDLGAPAVATKPAHPLFPPDQAFLWLPGLPGEQVAYCTYNEVRDIAAPQGNRRKPRKPDRDKKHAPFAPPYRVSTETFITWHTNVTPPFPFHPVPISRTLGATELVELGRRVHRFANGNSDQPGDPLQILRNDRKCFVLAVLAEMGYLAGKIPQPC